MTEPLLIVDVQCGFINQFTHHIPKRVARLIEKNAQLQRIRIYSLFPQFSK